MVAGLLGIMLFIVSCFIKIQNGFTFLVPAYPACPGKAAVKCVVVLGREK